MRHPAPPLTLTGLVPAPSQVCGALRIVPLLRERPCRDVRLARSAMPAGVKAVDLPELSGRAAYLAFVPHALVLQWGPAVGAQVQRRDRAKGWACHEDSWGIEGLRRLRQREGPGRLRLLPQHLAMEGLLALHFAPPTIAWPELSQDFQRHGLMQRQESMVRGWQVPGYDTALRTFEIHPEQVGSLIYAADALMAAFVVPSAQDYRLLHRTLLDDMYGELMVTYACMPTHDQVIEAGPHMAGARGLADLRRGLETLRRQWAQVTEDLLLGDWRDRGLRTEAVYRPGGMVLDRFITDLDLSAANHIGERLVREDGEVLYLSTMRLSKGQTRRVHLLSALAQHEWHLGRAAQALHTDVPGLIARIEAHGFGYLINRCVRERATKERRSR
ncbi:ARPP-2 domain-containing protein [Actinomyces bowdenii]|uniref:ARG and Rhodanese-Phosphatase-superfamily-associated domain-containing protein n=1 Tax=Actinomyces bowdenii TaxID=131109 RepID=A0A853EL72_9ACTO|nr:hypothetical protein [Actinomyces bowdenii]MBF0697815.1 hypothetical protein [Actinomyces bowdenii]NYS69988.1 hypothetical protein [Actinomyces bowdenii]